MGNKLIVTAAPHITSADSTQKIMQRVCIALMPALVASVIIFGINALIITAVTVAACVIFEYLYCKLVGREVSIGDFSAVVTGLLLAFNLPSTLPFWMPIVGAFIAIVVVKQLFGGLGYNFANPAIVGRIAMAMGFAGRMSTYGFPQGVDATSAATPLSSAAEGIDYVTLLLGTHGGVLGETCSLALIIGGVFLIAVGTIKATIPVTYLATVAVISLLTGHDPLVQLLSGGLLLGAFFMATDYTTSPYTTKGQIVYGLLLGVITCGIRFWGNMAEGVSYAILIMNLLVPYINALTRHRPLGVGGGKK